MNSDGPYVCSRYSFTNSLLQVKGMGLHVDRTAVQWHVTVVLFFVILDLNFNEV